MGKVVAICVSKKKGTPKQEVTKAEIKTNFGIVGDAHSGDTIRQISLLAIEDIKEIKQKIPDITNGAFGENIITQGIDFKKISIGTRFKIGKKVIVEITQIGKECHSPCSIFYKVGFCIMPKKGIFAKVLNGGTINKNDKIMR